MVKKNDKRLCWNCDGYVHFHLERCPYCGVDLTMENKSAFKALDDAKLNDNKNLDKSFAPPYPAASAEFSVSDDEWENALENEDKQAASHEAQETDSKNHLTALLLLLPGVALFLFALVLILFARDGVLHLEWKESFAYFYFLGSVPLLIMGWKALK